MTHSANSPRTLGRSTSHFHASIVNLRDMISILCAPYRCFFYKIFSTNCNVFLKTFPALNNLLTRPAECQIQVSCVRYLTPKRSLHLSAVVIVTTTTTATVTANTGAITTITTSTTASTSAITTTTAVQVVA